MNRFSKSVAVAIAAAALSACGPSLKPGENYYPYSLSKLGRNPDILINHLGPSWTIWVDGQDKSKELGLSVDDSQLAIQGFIDISVSDAASLPLSPKFRLAMVGGVQCTGCSNGSEAWRHATLSAQ